VDPRALPADGAGKPLGNARKARKRLKWKSQTRLPELVSEMVNDALKDAKCKKLLKPYGSSVSLGWYIDS